MAEGDTSTTRMGRFRICPPNSPGPPEQLSHGRFRIIPQGNTIKTWFDRIFAVRMVAKALENISCLLYLCYPHWFQYFTAYFLGHNAFIIQIQKQDQKHFLIDFIFRNIWADFTMRATRPLCCNTRRTELFAIRSRCKYTQPTYTVTRLGFYDWGKTIVRFKCSICDCISITPTIGKLFVHSSFPFNIYKRHLSTAVA